jgi:hypothetical protein
MQGHSPIDQNGAGRVYLLRKNTVVSNGPLMSVERTEQAGKRASRPSSTQEEYAQIAEMIFLLLKILVWEDSQGKVWLSYNSPAYLQERHGLPQDLLQNIAAVGAIADNLGTSRGPKYPGNALQPGCGRGQK